MLTKKDVLNALSKVIDPEIGLNIVDLGLVYDVKIEDGKVNVKMTLTMPTCPLSKYIVGLARSSIERLEGVKEATIELVWDPPWNPNMMSEKAKKLLGFK